VTTLPQVKSCMNRVGVLRCSCGRWSPGGGGPPAAMHRNMSQEEQQVHKTREQFTFSCRGSVAYLQVWRSASRLQAWQHALLQ
jgi:hypothetical protein